MPGHPFHQVERHSRTFNLIQILGIGFFFQLRSLENEKKQVVKDLNELYKRQKEELEIQQLQHFQVNVLFSK